MRSMIWAGVCLMRCSGTITIAGVVDETERAENRTKSTVRARVEHPIGVIKRVFDFVKARYRGLAKNRLEEELLRCFVPSAGGVGVEQV